MFSLHPMLGVFALTLASCGPAQRPDAAGAPTGRGGVMGGGSGMMGGDTVGGRGMMSGGGMMAGGGMMGGRDTGAAPRPRAARAAAAAGCPAVDQTVVSQGRAVFVGNGNCQACHGANAKGTQLAPDLTDSQWLNIDGSYASIAQLVRTGVPHPKQHPAPMPPMGGVSLTSQQVCAVSAYVYSLGH
jgi:mono/diheme cytochrome c family protein